MSNETELLQQANAGDQKAMRGLVSLYSNAEKGLKDATKFMTWLQKLAGLKDPEMMFHLGCILIGMEESFLASFPELRATHVKPVEGYLMLYDGCVAAEEKAPNKQFAFSIMSNVFNLYHKETHPNNAGNSIFSGEKLVEAKRRKADVAARALKVIENNYNDFPEESRDDLIEVWKKMSAAAAGEAESTANIVDAVSKING